MVRAAYVGKHSDGKSYVTAFHIQCGEQHTVNVPAVLCRTWPYFSNNVKNSFVQLKDLVTVLSL